VGALLDSAHGGFKLTDGSRNRLYVRRHNSLGLERVRRLASRRGKGDWQTCTYPSVVALSAAPCRRGRRDARARASASGVGYSTVGRTYP
jgi:hypothetical protein